MKTETVAPSSLLSDSPSPAPRPDASVPPAGPGPVPPVETGPAPDPTGEPITDAPPVDGAGVPFDPNRHLPTKHPKTDRWMPRRRPAADPAGSGPTDPPESGSFIANGDEPEPGPATPAATGSPTAPAGDVHNVMAELHCRAFYGIAVAFLSDEWLASKDEHRANVDTLAAYYRAAGITPDSPGWALVAQAAAFAGRRFAMPKTQTRLGMFKSWIVAKVAGWRGARRAAAVASVGS